MSDQKMTTTRVAVVTGSNKGIGYAIVKGLCEKFNGIVYLTARDVDRGLAAVTELNKLGYSPKFHQLDVSDVGSIKIFSEFIKENHGGIDVLVNNAAIAFKNDATEPFAEQAEITINLNYTCLVETCNMLFPLLKSGARVVNISSCAGHLSVIKGLTLKNRLKADDLTIDQLNELMREFVTSAKNGTNVSDGWGNSAYCVSKVGVSAVTRIQQKILSADATRSNITVNSVHPGYVDTDMTSHQGPLTIEQGAASPLYLALMPQGEDAPKGCYFWHDKKLVDWAGETTPSAY